MRPERGAGRRTAPIACLAWLLLFGLVVFTSHLAFLDLPYYWDEAGQFVPAALDILEGGHLVPRSAEPNIHPPAVMAYLAAAWRVAGCRPAVTRSAMLLVASFGVLAAFLLARELCREATGVPTLLAAALLCVSPLFYSQAMLAQLDAPAMLFTTLALWLFVQDRLPLAAAACVALVLVKETGMVVPAVFLLWLAGERRYREACYFIAPAAVLGVWIAVLARSTGHWAGDAEFVRYNLYESAQPLRLAVTLARRLYYLFFANLHWVGTAAILYAWRRSRLFRTRPWRVAWLLVAAHVIMLSVLGGAALERYLLPVLPILYAAMVAGISVYHRAARVWSGVALTAGLLAGNFINPPYPFPYENNLTFTDFLKVHAEAADYLERRYPGATVSTVWPLTAELSNPRLGFVRRGLSIQALPDLAPDTISSLDWNSVEVLVAFSRTANPPIHLSGFPTLARLWHECCGDVPNATPDEVRTRVPLPRAAHFQRREQWLDVYANPRKKPVRATAMGR